MTDRKLASIEVITDLSPIKGADRIEVASIKGWKVVVRKDIHHVGEKVVYLEIDSFLPPLPPFSELSLPLITVEGKTGYRLRTIKLRGQWSQGLVLPLLSFPGWGLEDVPLGTNMTERLSIELYDDIFVHPDPRLSAFPGGVRKTTLERIQNMEEPIEGDFCVTYKLDGESITILPSGVVCSKDWKLSPDHPMSQKVRALYDPLPGYVIQGEWYKNDLYVFALQTLGGGPSLDPIQQLKSAKEAGYKTVPIFICHPDITRFGATREAIIALTERACSKGKAEGLVWKSLDGSINFKAVSNNYLGRAEGGGGRDL